MIKIEQAFGVTWITQHINDNETRRKCHWWQLFETILVHHLILELPGGEHILCSEYFAGNIEGEDEIDVEIKKKPISNNSNVNKYHERMFVK